MTVRELQAHARRLRAALYAANARRDEYDFPDTAAADLKADLVALRAVLAAARASIAAKR